MKTFIAEKDICVLQNNKKKTVFKTLHITTCSLLFYSYVLQVLHLYVHILINIRKIVFEYPLIEVHLSVKNTCISFK